MNPKFRPSYWIYRMIGVRYGPYMYQFRDQYWYVDTYGTVWSIRPTGDPRNPFMIIKEFEQ